MFGDLNHGPAANITRAFTGNPFDANHTRAYVLQKFASLITIGARDRADEWINMTNKMFTFPSMSTEFWYILPSKWTKAWELYCFGDLLQNPAINVIDAHNTPRKHPGLISFSHLF